MGMRLIVSNEPPAAIGLRPVGQQIRESLEAQDLARFIYRSDQRLGRAVATTDFESLLPTARDPYFRRAEIAIRLGDVVTRSTMYEHAGLALAADITARLRGGQLNTGAPETLLGLNAMRRLAKTAVTAALAAAMGLRATTTTTTHQEQS